MTCLTSRHTTRGRRIEALAPEPGVDCHRGGRLNTLHNARGRPWPTHSASASRHNQRCWQAQSYPHLPTPPPVGVSLQGNPLPVSHRPASLTHNCVTDDRSSIFTTGSVIVTCVSADPSLKGGYSNERVHVGLCVKNV
ncbi:hypothetical protein J6590_002485 [Homalodisca vitripennis]|nr:hypothetical protein J6590_002485 [Homalodisca vitripennis]